MSNVKQNGDLYIVEDTTNGGYVDRMTYNNYQHWKTIWSKDLELKEFYFDGRERSKLLINKDDFEHHKATRTRARHLRILKEHLGLETSTKKKKEMQTYNIIYKERAFYGKLQPIALGTGTINDATLDIGNRKYRKRDIFYSISDNKKENLMIEYNKKLQEFIEYEKRIINEIFGQEK
jgi:hypothetical protein